MMTTARALDVGSYVVERASEPTRRRRERDQVERIAMSAYVDAGGLSPTGGTWLWTPHRTTWIGRDAVVKVARGSYGGVSLRQDRATRARIHTDPATEGWRERVASTLWSGTTFGRFVVVEERLPGTSLEPLMHDRALLASATDQLVELHDATRHRVVADDNRLMCWFRGPALTVSALLERWGRPRLGAAVTAWATRVVGELHGGECEVCLVHGDLWPGNVLMHGGRVTGLIDWDQAATHDAALHDLLHLGLYPAARERRTELGLVVRDCLHTITTRGELGVTLPRQGLEGSCRDVGLSVRDALIWYWLRHVSRMSSEPGHSNNPRWVSKNVMAVANVISEGNQP
jgi:hypothetical protein